MYKYIYTSIYNVAISFFNVSVHIHLYKDIQAHIYYDTLTRHSKAALLTSVPVAHQLCVCARACPRVCVARLSLCVYTGRGRVINHCLRADIRQPVNVN